MSAEPLSARVDGGGAASSALALPLGDSSNAGRHRSRRRKLGVVRGGD